ncbi:UNVERIFIED_CONTAM: hypothetical protein FKN15_076384 [Acipenser sinensis]
MVATVPENQDKTTVGEKAASSLRSTVMSREPPLKPTVEKQATLVMSREPPLKPTVEKQAMPVMSREPPLKPTVEKQATPVNVPKPTTKKSTIEKLRPQTPKKPLRIEDFILYPKWDIEEDYHRDPSSKKTVRKVLA